MVTIRIDISELDELLLDVLLQACSDKEDIDNKCLKPYEDACDYLTEKGYLTTKNGRIYRVLRLVKTRLEKNNGNQSKRTFKKRRPRIVKTTAKGFA